jgi:hypothetical protein
MPNQRDLELLLIFLLACFSGGTAWDLDYEWFSAAFAATAVVAGFELVRPR